MIVENKKYKNDENESPNDDSIEENDQNAEVNKIIEKSIYPNNYINTRKRNNFGNTAKKICNQNISDNLLINNQNKSKEKLNDEKNES